MGEELALAEKAVTRGVADTAEQIKLALRADVIQAGLGRRLANSWRSQKYPKNRESLRAAALVWTNAEKLIESYDKGVTIRSKEGFFLAIPTDSAPKSYRRKRVSPSNWPDHRYGPLRFVYRRNGPSLLVADNQRQSKRGGFALSRNKRALRTGRGLATVPMFVLVPQVRLKKRLNVDATYAAARARLAGNIDDAFRQFDRTRK